MNEHIVFHGMPVQSWPGRLIFLKIRHPFQFFRFTEYGVIYTLPVECGEAHLISVLDSAGSFNVHGCMGLIFCIPCLILSADCLKNC